MKFKKAHIEGISVIELEPFKDDRGLFSRILCREEFGNAGLEADFVQVNHSVTHKKGTIRGLHYQMPPHQEIKVIKCVTGQLVDVVVDLRRDSVTFLQHFKIELSESNDRMLYIPAGFAHGFQTLADNTSMIYFHSNYYHPPAERGLRYDDPRLAIEWPLEVTVISSKDRNLAKLPPEFEGLEL